MSTPSARQSDVATLDAILHAFYETVSGACGQPRDWDRFRSLLLPGARLMPIVSIPGEKAGVRFLSTEDFIHRVGRTGRAGSQGRATTLVAGAEVIELRSIERALKLRIERRQMDANGVEQPKRLVQNTLASRTLTALPGEVFV